MNSRVEVAEIKAQMADEVLVRLNDAIQNAEKSRIGIKGGADALARMLQQFKGYKTVVEKAMEDQTNETREQVMIVFQNMVTQTLSRQRDLGRQSAELGPFVSGIQKAMQVVSISKDLEVKRAVRKDEIVAEDEKEDAERAAEEAADAAAEAAPAAVDAENSPDPTDEVEAPVAEVKASPAEDPKNEQLPEGVIVCAHDLCQDTFVDGATGGEYCVLCTAHKNKHSKLPSVQDMAKRNPAPAPEEDVCGHCSDIITMATGSEYCSPCVSHRNKYKALPSDKALKNRRKRADADT
jgi:hypothetical protein